MILQRKKKVDGVEIKEEDMMDIENVEKVGECELRKVKMEDFRKALLEISASVSENAIAVSELRRWNEMYGEGGNRKKPYLTYFG